MLRRPAAGEVGAAPPRFDSARLREAEGDVEAPTGPRRARLQPCDYASLAAAMFGAPESEGEDDDFSPTAKRRPRARKGSSQGDATGSAEAQPGRV